MYKIGDIGIIYIEQGFFLMPKTSFRFAQIELQEIYTIHVHLHVYVACYKTKLTLLYKETYCISRADGVVDIF